MRLSTKILLLTLAIALALAVGIGYFVTRDVRRHEEERARRAIRAAVNDYFERIGELHATVDSMVRLVMEEPNSRAQLVQIDGEDPEAREFARHQLAQELFGRLIQNELGRRSVGAPSFHVLLDREGRTLVAHAPGDPSLAPMLRAHAAGWPYAHVVDHPVGRTPDARDRRYVRVSRGGGRNELYLAMAVPLRPDLSPDAPATHCYFVGYRVDDRWTRTLLARSAASPADLGFAATRAAGPAGVQPRPPARPAAADITIQAMFFVDGKAVARSGAGDTNVAATLESAISDAVARTGVGSHERREIAFAAAGEHFVGEAVLFPLAPGTHGALAVASSLTAALAELRRLQGTIALITAGALLLAVGAFQVVSQLIARPVRQLVEGTQRVSRGEFDEPVRLKRRDELGELARSFNAMAQGLKQRDLIKDLFGKVLDPRIVERYVADPTEAKPGGERRVQSVLFSDLEGFTGIAERLPAQDLVRLLNAYLEDAERTIAAEDGLLDKFVGDGVMAFWGPPFHDRHAARACRAALRMAGAADRQADACRALGVPPLTVRVGVATGELVVGNVGSSNHFGYTVLGDAANLGSRLEGLNKLYRTRVLVDGRTAREAAEVVVTRRVDRVRVVGRKEPVELHEVLATRGTDGTAAAAERLRDAYGAALALYEARDFGPARHAFERLAEAGDETSRLMASRCIVVAELAVAGEWDGVWTAETK